MATKKSVVWDDFLKIEENKVKCKICQAILKYEGGSTSNLLKHIQGVHKKDTTAGSSKQKSLIDFGVTTGKPCPIIRKEKIDQLFTAVVTENSLPFTFTESNSFRNLLLYMEPNYKPMCRKTVKKKIEEQAVVLKQQIKKTLENCNSMSLTTDLWTSINNESFMAITCSFISENWKVITPVLKTRYLTERHFAEYLQGEISYAIEDWGIKKQVFAIVHDNASNIKNIASSKDETYVDIGCAAHTLQICINDAMGTNKTTNHPISKTVNAASRLVSHFSHSTVANNELKKRQKNMLEESEEQQIYSLIQQVRTRWNSIADMFERILKLRWPISAVLSDRAVTKFSDAKTLDLTNEQWELIENILPTLMHLKKANTLLCGEKFVTLATVWPILKILVNIHLKTDQADLNVVKKFKTDLQTSITEKFQLDQEFTDPESIPVSLVATALDPRFKNLPFLDEDKRKLVFQKISQSIEFSNDTAENSEVRDPSPKRQKHSNDDYFAAYDEVAGTENASTNNIEKELNIYQSLETLDRNDDPLSWWQVYEKRLPQLAKVAKKYLAIPAISVASERHFSAAGRTLSKTRNRLLPGTTDLLLFVSENSELTNI